MSDEIASVSDLTLRDSPAKSRRIFDLPGRFKSAGSSVLVATASLIAGLVFWYWATQSGLSFYIRFENVPTPAQVASAFWHELGDKRFYFHILYSLRRIAIAYTFAAVLGIGLGLAVGRSRLARAVILPYVEIIRPIPAVAWIPLAILMWPTEESSIIFITALGALFPILLNAIHGVEQTPEILVRAAQSLGASRLAIFQHVVLPAALPHIVTGLAIGMGVSWFSLLAGEIISGQYGIGYFTWNAYSLILYPDIVVGMIVIGLLGTLSTYAVRLLARPLLGWQKENAMTGFKVIARTVRAHWAIWALMCAGLMVAYYAAQIAILYFRLDHLPNYVVVYDYPANVAQIIRSTPAVSDMVPIILDEWMIEIAYMDYNYGHGIAEWTMGIVPAKLFIIAMVSALMSINILLWRKARLSCSLLERRAVTGATGLGALMIGLANISLSWVVCCGTPNWAVGLALLGLDTSLSFALQPFGLWIAMAGIILLAASTLWFAGRRPTALSAGPHPGLVPEPA